jgi:hypothetical protein
MNRAEQLAETIRNSHDWEEVQAELEEICSLAGFEDTWNIADGETFETVLQEVARILEVEIY